MRTIEFNNEDIKECKLALLRQDLTSLQSAFLMQHITNLEQALNEIKDYIKSDKAVVREYENPTYLREEYCAKDILQIIDKVLGEE